MSIFKGTITKETAWQLNARKSIVQQEDRDSVFMSYTQTKNSWTRMSSFVNAIVPQRNSKGKKIGDVANLYDGDELARKYVLLGGTLYKKQLRGGVGADDSAYGSDIDKLFSSNKVGTIKHSDKKLYNIQKVYSNRPFGIRPMPGISSVTINNKAAYGSLREATIKYYCWDKHQLEELELLYMRVGYSVLLEWGWSHYLNYDETNLPDTKLNNIDFNSLGATINIQEFENKNFIDATRMSYKDTNEKTLTTTDTVIYELIDYNVKSTKCNYDAMLGIIKNFSWQLLPNGGYECTTILISRGEVISSLRLTNNGDTRVDVDTTVIVNNEPPLTKFEKIFYNLQAYLNNEELNNSLGSFYLTGSSPSPGFKTSQIITQTSEIIVNNIFNALKDVKSVNTFKGADGKKYHTYLTEDGQKESIGVMSYIRGSSTEGTGNEYISLNLFIYILNVFFTLKDETSTLNGGYFVKIILPQHTPCLASTNTISVDPSTCIIRNSSATLITGEPEGKIGYSPGLYFPSKNPADLKLPEFLLDNSRGDIGAILVSLNKLTTLFKDHNNGPDGVIMIEYLQSLLNDISASLGGINDFKIYIDKDKAQIFDAKYLEDNNNTTIDKKVKLDLLGLKSICRDVRITSRIFEEQSTMMAIAAQSSGNIGDIYSSTYSYLNEGLSDRLHPIPLPTGDDIKKYALALYADLKTLQFYIKNKCLGDLNNDPNRLKNFVLAINPEEIPTANSILKTFLLRISGEDIDYKDLIPFEVEITLDGIAGFVQGQIFTVDSTVLPRDYINKKVGLVITGISHTLQNNDWSTTLKTQICLLDQAELAANNPRLGLQKKLIEEIKKLIKQDKQNNLLWSAYADYLTYLTVGALKMICANKNADVISGDYVTSTQNGVGIINQDRVNDFFSPSRYPTPEFGKANNFFRGITNIDSLYIPKNEYFQNYYKNIWHPAAMASTNISAEIKATILSPGNLRLDSRNISTGFRYKYIDPTTGDIKEASLPLNLDALIVNGGYIDNNEVLFEISASNVGTYKYGDVLDPRQPLDPSRKLGARITNFLSRANKPYAVHVGEDTDDKWVIIPASPISNVHANVKVPVHPLLQSDGAGNYTFDTGIITRDEISSPKTWAIDVGQIYEFSRLYIQNLGSINRNDIVAIPSAINPQFTNFLSISIEIERTKNNPTWVKFDSKD